MIVLQIVFLEIKIPGIFFHIQQVEYWPNETIFYIVTKMHLYSTIQQTIKMI